MSNRNPSNFQSRSGRRVLATIALIIGMTGLAISIADGFWSNGQAPFPFVWRDVAVVHIASALPLAWFVTRMIRRRFRVIAFLCSAIGLIGICITWTLAGFSTELTWYAAIPTRAGLAFGIALPIAFVLREWSSDANEGLELRGGRSLTAALVTSVTALLALPTLYTNARCRQDCARLSEYLDQRRVGEARVIAHRVMALDAHAECRGQPIAKVAAILDSEVARLESLADECAGSVAFRASPIFGDAGRYGSSVGSD
jgi:hypothetical protein